MIFQSIQHSPGPGIVRLYYFSNSTIPLTARSCMRFYSAAGGIGAMRRSEAGKRFRYANAHTLLLQVQPQYYTILYMYTH